MNTLLLVLLTFPLAYGTDPASQVNRVLEQLKNPKHEAVQETFILTQDEVNAWASVTMGSKKRLGVQSLVLDLRDGGQFQAKTRINMDEVELEDLGIQLFQALLSGDQEFIVAGKLTCSEGRGTATVQQAHINDVAIPAFLVDAVIRYLTQNQPPHVDLTKPFELPFGIQDIRIVEGRMIISR